MHQVMPSACYRLPSRRISSPVARDTRMSLAQMNPDLRVLFQQSIEFLPELHIQDRPVPLTRVRPHPFQPLPR